MSELFEIADEVSVFRDGRFVGEHEASKVTRDDIIKLMVGREITQMFPKTEVPIGDVVLSVRNLSLDGRFQRRLFRSAHAAKFSASPASSAPGAATSPKRCSA